MSRRNDVTIFTTRNILINDLYDRSECSNHYMVIKLSVKWLTFLICVVLRYLLIGMDFRLRSNPEHGHRQLSQVIKKIITRTEYM